MQNELKEVLPHILPDYVNQLVSSILQGVIVYIENESKFGDEYACFEERLKELTEKPDENSLMEFDKVGGEWMPSSVVESAHASITVGEVQPSALRTDCHTVPLKQTLSKVRSMQERLQETIQQMSPAEQLAFVHDVHTLNVALMDYHSLEQLQQSSEVAKLAAVVLGMGQPQSPGYEHLLSHDFFSSFVNALATTLDSHGILFPHQPHVMEALQALAKGGRESRKPQYHVTVPTTSPEAEALANEDNENLDEKDEHFIESREQSVFNDDTKPEPTITPFHSAIAALYSIDKQESSDDIIYRMLVGEPRDRYKGSGVGSAFNGKEVEIYVHTLYIGDKAITDPFCKMGCGADLKDGLRVGEKSVLCKFKLQKNSTEKVPYFPSQIDKPPGLLERQMCLEKDYHSPPFCAEVRICLEIVEQNGTLSELVSVINNSSGVFSHIPEYSCKYGVSPPSPPTPPSWCWSRRLQGLSLINVRYFLCNGSASSVQELDTECNETVCHAAVHVFPDERVLPFLRILESRKFDVFIHRDKNGNVPLHIAVSTGNIEAVKMLTEISYKAIKIANCEGATPIDLAFNSNQNGIVAYLLDQMLTVYPKCPDNIELLQSLLLRAMKKGHTEYLRILLKLQSQYEIAINFNCTDSDGHTAWFYVKKLSSLVHEKVKDVLDDSNLEPELKASIKAQFMTKVSGQDECTATSEDVLVATAATCKHEKSAVTSGGHKAMVDGLDLATAYSSKKLKRGSKDKLLRDQESVSQSLPLVPPSVLQTLYVYTTDDYSEDDGYCLQKMNHRRKKKERKKPCSSRRTGSASFQFRPVGSGRSSSDQSTEPLLKPTLSMQKKLKKNVQRMRSMQRIEKYRRPTLEVESKKNKRRFKTGDSKARAKQKGAGSLTRYEEMETDTITPDDEECLSESLHQGVRESNAICSIPCTVDKQDSQLVVSSVTELANGKIRMQENGLGDEDSEPVHSPRVADETVTAKESSEWKGTIATFHKVHHYLHVANKANCDLLHFQLKLEHIKRLGQMMRQACSVYPSFATNVCLPSQMKMIKGTNCSAESPNTDRCTSKQVLMEIQDLVADEFKPEFPYRGSSKLNNNTSVMCTVHCITDNEMKQDLQHLPAGINLLDCRVRVPQIQKNEELQVEHQLYQQQRFTLTTYFLQFPSFLKLTLVCSLPYKSLNALRSLESYSCIRLTSQSGGLSGPLKDTSTQLLLTMICDEVADDKDVWLQYSPVHRKAVSKIEIKVKKVVLTEFDWRKTVFGSNNMIHSAKSHNSRYFLLVSCLDHILPLYTPRVNQNVVPPKKTQQVKSDEPSPTTAAKPKAPNTNAYKQVTKCSDLTLRSWVEEFIREHGFENLKCVIPRNIHFLLGLTQWKGQHMSNQFKKVLSEILDMARHNRSALPNYAISNLNSLSAMPRFAVRTPVRSAPARGGNKTGGNKTPGNKTLKLKLKQQSSTDPGRLAFANTNQPLEVIRSHLTTYSKCCPRHDIQNIVVICSTCPASAAFGPKRRYSAIKDLRDDTRHAPFNASTSFKGDYSTSRSMNHLSQQNHRVMSDKPMLAAVTRDKRAEPQTATEITHSHHQLVTRVSLRASLQPPLDVPNQKHQGQNSSGIHSMRNPLPGSHISTLSPYAESAERQRQLPSQLSKARHAPLSPVLQAPEHSLTTVMPSNSTRKVSEFNTADRTQLKPEGNLHRSAELLLRHTEHSSQHGENAGALAEHSGQYSRYAMEQRESQFSRNVTREPQDTAQHSLSTVEQREHKDRFRILAERLHAQDYHRIFPIAYEGKPPHTLPPELRIPYIFITGLAYYKLSSHKKSVQYFQQCLQLAEECGRDGDMTICCIYIGDIEFAQRKYNEAAERYQKALRYYSRDSVAKDFRMILPTQSALWSKCGSAFKNTSKMADSITAYDQAIEQASSKKDKLAAHTSLGNLYQGIGENRRAVKEYEDAIQLAAELDDKVSLGWNHGNLGNALLGLYQRDKALHHLFKALDMAVEHETTPQAIGRAYNNLGTAYQAINEYSEAEKHYDLALAQAIYVNGNDIPGQARVYGNIGNLQMLKKEFDRAVPHYTEVMRLSQDKSTVTTAHHNRGCAYYDWAEKEKMALHERTSPKSLIRFKVSLHGPQFEHCEDVYMPMMIPNSIQKYYLQGTKDLEYVMKHHEESFHGIKGSSKGLSLSVSLFETNSRTFHRMQDCLIHLKKSEDEPSRFEDALLVAEQSRARTLGELLLKRRGPQLKHQLTSPPSLAQLKSIVARQSCPVVYLSYTGERLLGWVLVPTTAGECSLNMFEVRLSDSEFDGKSFDYHLRSSLNELLVEKRFEMYKPFSDEKEQTDPVKKLYNLVAKPLMTMFKSLQREKQAHEGTRKEVQKIIIVPDSYTNLLPYACLLNEDNEKFWGDEYYFQIMPSLLTMGILDQLPTVSVTIPVEHQQMICVVGNPTIPPFKYNDDEWNLGKLHATKEAEWVAHILKCKPILHEQATKTAVMMRLINAKVIHIATHGSAREGFLAFAGTPSSVCVSFKDIEELSILNTMLVVLSVYINDRGVTIPDGMQKLIQAFILAGAQAVLTTLWRVPDESACIFMQFFYQYLVDGVRGTEALHKAMLSVRCFSKYSQYIHWSGYQLTGREIQFTINQSSSAAGVTARLGNGSIFPQLDIIKKLEGALLNNPRLPTDVQVLFLLYNNVKLLFYQVPFPTNQVLRGPPGVKPSEPLIDFIHSHHLHFTGGIFWINCRTTEIMEASDITHVSN